VSSIVAPPLNELIPNDSGTDKQLSAPRRTSDLAAQMQDLLREDQSKGTTDSSNPPAKSTVDKEFGHVYIDGLSDSSTLTQSSVEAKAQALHDAIHSGIIAGDADTVLQTLGNLSESDRQAVKQQYDKDFAGGNEGSLLTEAKRSLYDADYKAVETVLDRKDGKTNLVGDVAVAMALAKNNPEKGNELLVSTLKSLNTDQIRDLQADYKSKYNVDLNDAIRSNPSIADSIKNSDNGNDTLTLLEKGSDKRDSADLLKLAENAIKAKDVYSAETGHLYH
jgi:hypothetical protein